jgi:hypothetical protein
MSASESPENPEIAASKSAITVWVFRGQADAIFEPFVQHAASPLTERQGVGLGLAISRDLAVAWVAISP